MSSCLPTAALSHFEQREQELLALNGELEQKKTQALSEASNAVRDAESSSLQGRPFRPPVIPDDGNPWGGEAAQRRKPSLESPVAGAPLVSSLTERPGSSQLLASSLPLSRPLTGASERPGSGHLPSSSPPLSRPLTGASAAGAGEGGEALHTTIRYQNSRIIALQEELDRARAEVSSRDAEMHQLRQDKKKISG